MHVDLKAKTARVEMKADAKLEEKAVTKALKDSRFKVTSLKLEKKHVKEHGNEEKKKIDTGGSFVLAVTGMT